MFKLDVDRWAGVDMGIRKWGIGVVEDTKARGVRVKLALILSRWLEPSSAGTTDTGGKHGFGAHNAQINTWWGKRFHSHV